MASQYLHTELLLQTLIGTWHVTRLKVHTCIVQYRRQNRAKIFFSKSGGHVPLSTLWSTSMQARHHSTRSKFRSQTNWQARVVASRLLLSDNIYKLLVLISHTASDSAVGNDLLFSTWFLIDTLYKFTLWLHLSRYLAPSVIRVTQVFSRQTIISSMSLLYKKPAAPRGGQVGPALLHIQSLVLCTVHMRKS